MTGNHLISTTKQTEAGDDDPPGGDRSSRTPVTIDLCCGLGGLSLAAKLLGFRVIAGVDVNSSAIKTFSRNFPEAISLEGSVRSKTILARCTKLAQENKAAGSPVVVLSGPPCQGFSIAGSRNPSDPRNKVFVAVARAISVLQPDCALIENVSMLLAEKYGERVQKFEKIFSDDGFHVTHVVLNASDFGVPQKRKRAFFLVTKRLIDKNMIVDRLEKLKTEATTTEKALEGLSTPEIRPDDYDDETNYGQVHNHFAMQHSERVKKKIAAIEPGKGPMSYRRLHPTRLSNTLFSGHRAPPAHFTEPRSITVREAARLQGFPDDFRIFGSFANQMEQVTNSVPPPLARAILRILGEVVGLLSPSHA